MQRRSASINDLLTKENDQALRCQAFPPGASGRAIASSPALRMLRGTPPVNGQVGQYPPDRGLGMIHGTLPWPTAPCVATL